MPKFCTKCGQPLIEGQPHVCGETQPTINATINLEKSVQEMPVSQPTETQVNQQGQYDSNMQVNPQMNQQGQYDPNMQVNPQMNQQGQYNPNMQVNPQMNQQGQYNPNMQGNPQMNQQMAAVQNVANGCINEFMMLIKSPITYGRKFAEKGNVVYALILMVLQGIAAALFGVVGLVKVSSAIDTILGFLGTGVDFPYVKAFFVTLILSVLFSVLLCAVMFGINKILKLNISFTQVMSLVAVRSVFVVPAILVSMLFFIINVGFGLVLFTLTAVVGFVVIGILQGEIIPQEKKNLYAMLLAAGLVVFIIITTYIISKSSVTYLPEDIVDYVSDPSKLLRKMLY